MRILISAISGIMLLVTSGLAWSGAETGFYLGASIGSTDQDVDTSELSFNDDATGKKIFLGYNFGLIPLLDIALEAAYVDFGETSFDSTAGDSSAQLRGVTGVALAGIKLGTIGVFAKTGLIKWDSETTILGAERDDTGDDVVSGVGVRIQLGSLALRAEYEIVETDEIEIDFYTAGLSWTF